MSVKIEKRESTTTSQIAPPPAKALSVLFVTEDREIIKLYQEAFRLNLCLVAA